MNNPTHQPIGVFDSGVGGLTVVRELSSVLPNEDIVYLGDSARVPYGIKSLETIRRFAMEDATFLMRFNPKLIVVACNTASAAAIDDLRAACPVPVVDVIRPGAEAALAVTDQAIGIIATEATIKSNAYQRAILRVDAAREVIQVACPLLVPIVEEGRPCDDPIVLHVLGEYLRDLQRIRPGALILGCTHYPLLTEAIAKLMGPKVKLVSSGQAAAEQVRILLEVEGWKNAATHKGTLHCYTTDNPERFGKLTLRFGGRPADRVEYIGTDELEGTSPKIEINS